MTAARERLTGAGITETTARLDAELLARHALGWDRATLLTRGDEEAPASFRTAYGALVDRRALREPASFILGTREFWGLEFEVSRDALIPRQESELLVETALALVGDAASPLILDVGTGSGCLAIALAVERPRARVLATDLSAAALRVAARNAARHGVTDRIEFRVADLVEGLDIRADLIVSNPPYVPSGAVAVLAPEVRDHEPHLALAGGTDGLDVIRRLVETAPRRLTPGGRLLLEFGYDHRNDLERLLGERSADLEIEGWRNDLQDIPRVVVCRRRNTATPADGRST